jgi:hypothetical protein
MTAGKEILEACRIHTRETALARSTSADVSPMTWNGAQYVFTITSPEPEPEVQADEPAPVHGLELSGAGPEILPDARGGYLVASASEPGTYHRVRLGPVEHCDCKGFQYRGRCRHVEAVQAFYAQTAIELEEADEDDDEPDETAHQAEVLQHINVSDVLRATAELLQDDDLGSPLVQQIAAWLDDPMTAIDPKHLPLREYAAVGRHVLSLAAAVLERQLQAAQGRLGNQPF